MDRSTLERTYREAIAAISAGDAKKLTSLMTEHPVDRDPLPNQPPGREGFAYFVASAHRMFANLTVTVDELVIEGDRLAGRVTWRGLHHGELFGVAPTGRPVRFSAFHLLRFEGGKIAEWAAVVDLLGALTQVGARVVGPKG